MTLNYNPTGPSSYNRISKEQPYRTWKGTGVLSNPVGITSGNIRPQTNRDYTNNVYVGFGLPRPLKWQYRKGTTSNKRMVTVVDPNKPGQYIEINRESQSTKSSSLIGQIMDRPGQYSVKENPIDEVNEKLQYGKECMKCDGVAVVTNYMPNNTFLTNNPVPRTTSKSLCCNEERKALNMVKSPNTNLSKKYYTTTKQYLQNRCQTYKQRIFNFQTGVDKLLTAEAIDNGYLTEAEARNIKPGSALALTNTYVANCYPNTVDVMNSQFTLTQQVFDITRRNNVFTKNDVAHFYSEKISTLNDYYSFLGNIEGDGIKGKEIYDNFVKNPYYGVPLTGPANTQGCKLVVYKPSNPQFAVQGGVSSSTRMLKLTVDTINKSITSEQRLKGGGVSTNGNSNVNTPFIYKNKHSRDCPKERCIKSVEYQQYKALSKLGHIGKY